MFKIAISGKAGTGKDTAARIIKKTLKRKAHIKNVKKIAFATPIKNILMIMFPAIDEKKVFGSSEFRSEIIPDAFDDRGAPLTVRQALIDIGTKLGRVYKNDLWLDVFDFGTAKITNAQAMIVMDVRFENEFNHLKNKNFYTVRIKRDTAISINHSSETNQDFIKDIDFDFVIDNNKTMRNLENQVGNLVDNLMLCQSAF